MGLSFVNVFLHKTSDWDTEEAIKKICRCMLNRGYRIAKDGDKADMCLYINDPKSDWLTVSSDMYGYFSDDIIPNFSRPLSGDIKTKVLTIACFDSDGLLFNLTDVSNGKEAWAKSGHLYGSRLSKRFNAAEWTCITKDTDAFQASLRRSHVFAEEALDDIEPLLGLSVGQSAFLFDATADDGSVRVIRFSLRDEQPHDDPPLLEIVQPGLLPSKFGSKYNIVSSYNKGGASVGLGVAFWGDYVQNGDITFKDVALEYGLGVTGERKTIPLQLELRELKNGQSIYYGEAPDFKLPEKVNEHISQQKLEGEKHKREFLVRFTPEGNERKALDICVILIPLSNYAGQCSWCVWHRFGSKEAYFEAMKSYSHVTGIELNPKDYD